MRGRLSLRVALGFAFLLTIVSAPSAFASPDDCGDQADSTPCEDGDACTSETGTAQTPDHCESGVCTGIPVDCSALDDQFNDGVCNAATGACERVPCGETAQPCCDGGMCDMGFVCSGAEGTLDQGSGSFFSENQCFPCGGEGDPCCDQQTCNGPGLLCGGIFCEECGGFGQQCCAADTCPIGGSCIDGGCVGAVPVLGASAVVALVVMLAGVGLFGILRLRTSTSHAS